MIRYLYIYIYHVYVWECFESMDCLPGNCAAEIQNTNLDACKNICKQRGFTGVVICDGWASFRCLPRSELVQSRKSCPGSTLYVLPDPERSAQLRMQKAVRMEGMPCQANPTVRGNLFLLLHIVFPKHLPLAATSILHDVLPSTNVSQDDEVRDADILEYLLCDPGPAEPRASLRYMHVA